MQSCGYRKWVVEVLIGLICLIMLALIIRLGYLQAVQAKTLLAYAEERQTSQVELPGRRGAIMDRHLRVLAGSQDLPTVFVDPRMLPDRSEAAGELARVLGQPAAEILEKLNHPTSPGYVVLARALSGPEAEAAEMLTIPGVGIRDEPARTYPMGSLGAHVVGFVGRDGHGLEGIEMTCEKHLRAESGRRVVFRDIGRHAVFQQANSYVPPRDGAHVVLTIDAAIQGMVERAVAQQVEHFEAECGLGIVMDPNTGELLALANYPTFEPAQGSKASREIRRNRALTDPVEPGSIFKPYVMAAALSEGLARKDESIYCEKGLFIIGKRQLHDHHPYADLTVAMIMAKSSNIGMAKLGLRLGNERIYEHLKAFGYGGCTGIDLPGEDNGLLMPLQNWNSYSTTSVPMGQELAVTPIQILTAFSSLVNGGRLMRPRVVSAIMDRDGSVIEDRSKPIEKERSLDAETAAIMRDILVQVVTEGTGRRCDLEQWQVLGKTGTAQVPWKGRRGYEPNAYLGSFIAAAPASDPAVAVLVMIRKPNRRIGYYGGTVALPAVKAILEQALPYLNVAPDKTSDNRTTLVWRGHD